jgi:hypothetical protein
VGASVDTVSTPTNAKEAGRVAFLLATAAENDEAKVVALSPIDVTDAVAVLPCSAVKPVTMNCTSMPLDKRLGGSAAFKTR